MIKFAFHAFRALFLYYQIIFFINLPILLLLREQEEQNGICRFGNGGYFLSIILVTLL